ncbi:MAG: lamin tail domain-containing protein [Verrucomicrobiota bacterium]
MKFVFSVMATVFFFSEARSAVVINEFMAAASDRRVSHSDGGVPRFGSGLSWTAPEFPAATWPLCTLPAGYNFTGLSTDLRTSMSNQAPSLYLRKTFSVASDVASSTNPLVLQMQYNDGFIAYLNGREVARSGCGPTNLFMFASQPAYTPNTNSGTISFSIGNASQWLVAGNNVLAIQAHNAEQPSTASNPEQITSHTPTPEFRVTAGLAWTSNSSSFNLVAFGPTGGGWRYFIGRCEPSGGVVDPGFLTNSYTPPSGEEGDYDAPAAPADWVELANTDSSPVDLSGWSLTDDSGAPGKWHFPTNTILPANGFLVVLCDNRDEANAPAGPALYLHTNFKLSSDGEFFGLYDASGTAVDTFSPGYPSQVFYCSYGRNPSNPDQFGYFDTATPGTNNSGTFYPSRVAQPLFKNMSNADLPGGLYTASSLTLQLLPATPGSTVRYTLDGSEPTPVNGITYSSPLTITQSSDKTGVVVRARAFLSGSLGSDTASHTYLLKQPAALTNAPALLMSSDAGRSFYNPAGIMAIAGGSFVPVYSYGQPYGNVWFAGSSADYNQPEGDGYPFERPVHFEYYFPASYYPPGQAPVRDEAGLRLSGSNYQRPRYTLQNVATDSPWAPWNSLEKPSFNIHFNGDYGSDPIDYPFFTNYPVHKFQHLRLRAGKNDNYNPWITDELVRRLWIDLGHAGARGIFCSLYLNATYKGVFNLTERFRTPFFQQHCNSSAEWDIDYSWTWVDGDNSTFYGPFTTTLNSDLTVPANWQSITNQIDIDNTADYYLLNIYCAMWDWPNNNFVLARERSTGPNSRFRFAVWDAEGAFNVNSYYNKSAAYNTVSNDLLLDSNIWDTVPHIFNRLYTSPEFRLRFADRVNLHLFNGGALDDRDPDGSCPLKSHFAQRLGELIAEAGPLVQYNSGSAIATSAFDNWVLPTAGRRSYLLGTATGRRILRDARLWPVTEPPQFSQFGGTVPANYSLSITSAVATAGQTAALYYTTNGADPRITGGTLNPAALLYSGPVSISRVLTVSARARNNTTGEWSPLTQATFAVSAEPASSNNLAVAEIMYHPPKETLAETAAGFTDADAFEFLRLQNVGTNPVDLAGCLFTVGITFDFNTGSIRYLSPGGCVLIVKQLTAFQARYGHAYDALVDGEYGGNLSNSGEQLRMVAADGSAIRDFVFDDAAPWPVPPDGYGPSLVLRNPYSNPNHALAANWTASAQPGGMPGGVPNPQTFSAWRSLYWDYSVGTNDAVAGPAANPDGDGMNNLQEYIYGLNPTVAQSTPQLVPALEVIGSNTWFTVSLAVSGGASDVTIVPQISEDLSAWSNGVPTLQLLSSTPLDDGRVNLKYGDTALPGTNTLRFVRFRFDVAW